MGRRAVRAGAAILFGSALAGLGLALYEPPVSEEETSQLVNHTVNIVEFSDIFEDSLVDAEGDVLEFEILLQQEVESEPVPLFVNVFGQDSYDVVHSRLEAAGLVEHEDSILDSYLQIEKQLALLATSGIDIREVFEHLLVPADLVELAGRYSYLLVNEEDMGLVTEYVQDAFEDSDKNTAAVLVYGIPYRRSNGERIATPDLLIDIDIALDLMNNRDTGITVLKLNNPTERDFEHNLWYNRFLLDRLSGIGLLLDEARSWMSEHPDSVLADLSTEEALSALYWIVREHDASYLTFTVHGDSHGLLLSLSDSGRYTPVRFETLADYLVRGIADGDVRKLVLRLNQCGGSDIAENLLSAVHELYLAHDVPEERRPELLVQLSSVNSERYHQVNLIDYQFTRFAMALNKEGIMTDSDWEFYNNASAASYAGSEGDFSMQLFQGADGIDLEVRTYTLLPDGSVVEVEGDVLEPFVLRSYLK